MRGYRSDGIGDGACCLDRRARVKGDQRGNEARVDREQGARALRPDGALSTSADVSSASITQKGYAVAWLYGDHAMNETEIEAERDARGDSRNGPACKVRPTGGRGSPPGPSRGW